jgi:hypothetical protein
VPRMIWTTGNPAVTGPLVIVLANAVTYTFDGGKTDTFVAPEHVAAATTAVQSAVPGSTLTATSE